MPLWGEVVEALNSAAQRQTLQAGGLVIDAWRMTESLPTTAFLWDGFHMRHKFSAVVMNLAINAAHAARVETNSWLAAPRSGWRRPMVAGGAR